MRRTEKPYTKEQENREIQALIDGVKRHLARIEAERESRASRYTVVFEIGPRNNAGGPVCWRARLMELPVTVTGETLEETALLIARKISKHRTTEVAV